MTISALLSLIVLLRVSAFAQPGSIHRPLPDADLGSKPPAPMSRRKTVSAKNRQNGNIHTRKESGTMLVPQIGSIMRKFGQKNQNPEWETAAKLQDLWLSFPKHVASPVAPDVFDYTVVAWPVQTGLTMDWILKSQVDSDGRAKFNYGGLQGLVTSTDPSDPANLVIQKQVNRMFSSTSANTVQLGGIKWAPDMDLKAFHAQQIQRTTIKEDLTTPIDPLQGALGTFNFYAIPIGQAKKLTDGTVRVDISDFVIYVIDSFDFQDPPLPDPPQALGFWQLPDKISKSVFDGGTLIMNKDYRDYRDSAAANGKGGDFLVVTDTKTIHLPKSFTFIPDPTINGTWISSDPKHRFGLSINGNSVDWTETGPETGLVYKAKLNVSQQGDSWRIDRPNNSIEILKMLGFQDAALQQAILNNNPHPSFLVFKLQNGQIVGQWKGIRVKKTPQGNFQSLVQPEDPNNTPGAYTFTRTN